MAGHKRTGAEDAFMRWALLHILGQGTAHPLAFLIDWQRKDWHSRKGSRRADALSNEHFPPVQPGHLQSFRSLANPATSERLALEDADFNQEKNYSVESRGGWVETTAFDIGGVPVEAATAQMWQRVGVLPPPAAGRWPPHPGWARV